MSPIDPVREEYRLAMVESSRCLQFPLAGLGDAGSSSHRVRSFAIGLSLPGQIGLRAQAPASRLLSTTSHEGVGRPREVPPDPVCPRSI